MLKIRLSFACLLWLPLSLWANPLPLQAVPEPLKPWVSWVLFGQEEKSCPFLYNNADEHFCAWPTRLGLNLEDKTGSFSADWRVDAETWVELPGGAGLWPQQVQLDGQAVAVAAKDERPAVWLKPGQHRLTGKFLWDRLPESLPIPKPSGLVSLAVKGKNYPPSFDDQGALWLQGHLSGKPAESNALTLRVFRRIIDGVPLQVLTHLDLEVSGTQREITLSGGLLPDAIPLTLNSPLPTRLEKDGRLRVQIRPGVWAIELTSRWPGEVKQLDLPANPVEPWPSDEVWSFQANPQIRVVELQGARAADPRQTQMPETWRDFPAYFLEAGENLQFNTLRRGDPDAAPDQLSLNREFWLDFDGGGYTVRDEITGQISRDWRLDALPVLKPGKVEIAGAPQLLTQREGAVGVELRQGHVNLNAVSRGEGSISHWPATGWKRDFQSLQTTFHLPPGWRVLAATGVDQAPDTWVEKFTLWDLFLLLIIALGIGKLRGWQAGALAFVALILLWHEPGAPRNLWLHLLAAVALLQWLPEGRAQRWLKGYRNLTLLAFAFVALPFIVEQVRSALYPQLELGWRFQPAQLQLAQQANDEVVASPEARPASPAPEAAGSVERSYAYKRKMLPELPSSAAPASNLNSLESDILQNDPDALTQTGPGQPNWQWRSLTLRWNGPVLADQEVGLVLLNPKLNRILNFARVGMLAVLLWLVLAGLKGFDRFKGLGIFGKSLVLILLVVQGIPQAKAEMPSPAILEELRGRLLAAPECLPECAQVSNLRVKFSADSLAMQMEVHALAPVAIPLPAQQGHWLPTKASVDGAEASALFRDADGQLWLGLTPGKHELVLLGDLPSQERLQLALPLKPQRVEVEGNAWQVEGIKENGEPEGQLQFTRSISQGQQETLSGVTAIDLPPFLELRRTLQLGLTWRVETSIVRAFGADSPVILNIPLLEGESVTTPGFQVKNGQVSVSLQQGQQQISFQSNLAISPTIKLKAGNDPHWTEVWLAEISPIWHLQSSGLAPVSHQDSQGNWRPLWRPWPQESLELALTRPTGAAGTTLTLENSQLDLAPGLRATEVTLQLQLQSSQGGQHTLQLPEGAALIGVAEAGKPLLIRQQGRAVTLPLHPGAQNLSLNWRQSGGILPWYQAPVVDVGLPGVNFHGQINLNGSRWVLLVGGPTLGPAVLFWGVLLVIALVAYALGKTRFTPLKAWQWFLLLLGLAQVELMVSALVIAWLFALGLRGSNARSWNDAYFNAAQLGLALLTIFALGGLFYAVQQGLLGIPDMQIEGNGSSAGSLLWYEDRTLNQLPRPWLLSAPLWVYRLVMLLWASWLAYSLLAWLRWGVGCYSEGGWWRPRKITASKDTKTEESST